MCPVVIVIVGICGQDPLEVPRTEDENVIEAVAPQRSDRMEFSGATGAKTLLYGLSKVDFGI